MRTNLLKHLNAMGKGVSVGILLLMFSSACKKDLSNNKAAATAMSATKRAVTSTNGDLIAYKNSAHQLMVGYYRTWGDKTVSGDVNGPAMTDMPDSVDIISNFTDYTPPGSPYWSALKNTYIPALHAKGTKVLNTQGLPNTISDTSFTNHYANNSTGYAAWALATYNSYNAMGYDGIDLDVESLPSGATLTADVGLVTALSQYFGPKATTGKLLILDTNQDGTSSFFRQVSSMISYLYLQAYWRQTSSLAGTFNTYAAYIRPNQFIPIVDFEDGSGDGQNPNYVYNPVQIYQYAGWQPTQGTKGGVGSYGIDNEYYQIINGVHNPYTHNAIQMMNSVNGGAGVFNPASYYKIKNHTSGLVLDGNGATTAGSLVYQLSDAASNNLQWQIILLSDGYYKIKNHTSGLVLDGKGATAAGSPLGQWSDVTSNNLEWQITALGNGYYKIKNHTSGLVVDGKGATTSGSASGLWSDVSSPNLEWQINVLP